MDPQNSTRTSPNDLWKLLNTVKSVQEAQEDLAHRLLRLEKRREEDAKVKSVWGQSSYTGVLGATPQQNYTTQLPHNDFSSFDDDRSNTMVRSLQLDVEDEPRRLGTTSRANSVRFDDSANQSQWGHNSRGSADLFSKLSGGLTGLGGHGLFERSSSHKSDGRHSSAGQSTGTGRANSFGFELTDAISHPSIDPPGLAPGLFILGSVPTIVRCWISEEFKNESLLYAAVCTGSYRSLLSDRIIRDHELGDRVHQDINGYRRIKMPVYLPEAVLLPTTSRIDSTTPQLPSLSVDFTIIDDTDTAAGSKSIQIVLGSDVLRAHNADVLFSANQMTLFDHAGCKLSVPFVRPENDEAFKSLQTVSNSPASVRQLRRLASETRFPGQTGRTEDQNGEENADPANTGMGEDVAHPISKTDPSSPTSIASAADQDDNDEKVGSSSRPLADWKDVEPKEEADAGVTVSNSSRAVSSPALQSNWRREGNGQQPSVGDWANVSRQTSTNYARPNRDQGMKILRPSRQSSKTSIAPLSASSAGSIQSRFFDEGKRRVGPVGPSAVPQGGSSSDSSDSMTHVKRSFSIDNNKSGMKENAPSTSKTRSANPVGGASAFGWLNASQPR